MNAFIEVKQKPPINKLITFNKDKYENKPDATGYGDKDFAIVFDQARECKINATTFIYFSQSKCVDFNKRR